ncbi:Na+/H+ antiporter NhaC family protein [Anaerotignum sp.]|uniref:Na+/H+ antiporter NhaC family protein n=1 Tax=Anaerotignum sp. TaxID=2039241 RepID=UPI002714595F|nr:Na+/H+ antiporter NhaC family protein [Anaerotignum sp.]
MDLNEKKLEFYGGTWISFLPFIVFLSLIVLTTFIWGSISDGALWIPAFAAILLPFFLAKDKAQYANVVIEGMASKEAIIPVVCWIFAGVFSRVLRMSGLADGVAGVAAGFGVGSIAFAVITFISSAILATASGTGFGTIAAGMGVLYPAGVALGGNPALLAGAIISGAAFGDNLAPVSDTTICSATSQGVDVPGVVRSRLKYALTAGVLTIACIIIYGMVTGSTEGSVIEYAYNAKTLSMFIPVVATIFIAIKTGDIIIATTVGTVIGIVVGCGFGLFDFIQIDVTNPKVPAIISVYGEGLDRTVGGVIYTGINSMLQVCILALLLFGSINIMRRGRGDIMLLDSLGKIAKTPFSAELTISLMVVVLSGLMGLNAPAILAVGASFAKPLSRKHGISPYRTANLMDAQSNTLVYCLPWTPAMIYTLGFAADGAAPLTALQIMPCVFYCYIMLVVMIVTMFLGIGRKDYMDKLPDEIQAEYEVAQSL